MRSYFSAVGSEYLMSCNYNGTVFLGSAYGLLPSSSVKTQRNSQHRSLQTPSSLYRSLQRQVRFRLVNDCSMITYCGSEHSGIWNYLQGMEEKQIVVHILKAALK